jgi:hypothetical protein
MRLTWNIVWKDLTRLRLPMALWACLFLWEFAIGVRLLRGSTPDLNVFDRLRLYDYVAYGLQVAVSYILVAALIHEDPLVGSSAFWPTRPISGLRLLGAKLLGFLIIFGVFPAVVTLPWWLFCGYGAHEVFWAALDTFCLSVAVPVVGLTIAALTGNMSRFLAGSFLTVAFLAITFTAVTKPEPVFTQVKVPIRPEDISHGFDVLIWLVLLGFPIVAAHQFLTRRLARSLVILGCILGSLVYEESQYPLIQHLGEFINSAKLPIPTIPTLPTTDKILTKFKDAYSVQGDPARRDVNSPTIAVATIAVTEVPMGQYLFLENSTVEWSWPDGTRYIGYSWPQWSRGHWPSEPFPQRPPPREWWEWMNSHERFHGWGFPKTYELYLKKFWDDNPGSLWRITLAIPPEVMAKMRIDPPSFTIELKGNLYRWDQHPEIALARGNGWDEKAVGLRVGRTTWDPKESSMDITLIEHHPSMGTLVEPGPYQDRRVLPTVINRIHGESAQWNRHQNIVSARIGTVSISWDETWPVGQYRWTEADRPTNEPLTEDWFSNASVVGSVGTAISRFEKKITIEKFVLKDQDPDAPDTSEN